MKTSKNGDDWNRNAQGTVLCAIENQVENRTEQSGDGSVIDG